MYWDAGRIRQRLLRPVLRGREPAGCHSESFFCSIVIPLHYKAHTVYNESCRLRIVVAQDLLGQLLISQIYAISFQGDVCACFEIGVHCQPRIFCRLSVRVSCESNRLLPISIAAHKAFLAPSLTPLIRNNHSCSRSGCIAPEPCFRVAIFDSFETTDFLVF